VSEPNGGNRDPAPANGPAGELYDTRALLPLIVGSAAITAGTLLTQVGPARPGVLVVLLDLAVVLLVVAVVLYFVIGLWLIPGGLALGGLAVLAAFEVGSHGPRFVALAGAIELSGGAILAAYGLRRWQHPRGPRAPGEVRSGRSSSDRAP
jgi:hypothetical protein